jgi:hypothetical protein
MESHPISEKFRQWKTFKDRADLETSRANRLRDDLMVTVVEQGDKDEKGNIHYSLPSRVEVGGTQYKGIKREARTTTTLNSERALELAESKGIRNEVVRMVEEFDPDAFYAAYQRDKLTADEVDSVFDTKTTYAFKPVAE